VAESSLGPKGAAWELFQVALHTSTLLPDDRDSPRGSSIPPTDWALSSKARNRRAHAYNGNSSADKEACRAFVIANQGLRYALGPLNREPHSSFSGFSQIPDDEGKREFVEGLFPRQAPQGQQSFPTLGHTQLKKVRYTIRSFHVPHACRVLASLVRGPVSPVSLGGFVRRVDDDTLQMEVRGRPETLEVFEGVLHSSVLEKGGQTTNAEYTVVLETGPHFNEFRILPTPAKKKYREGNQFNLSSGGSTDDVGGSAHSFWSGQRSE